MTPVTAVCTFSVLLMKLLKSKAVDSVDAAATSLDVWCRSAENCVKSVA